MTEKTCSSCGQTFPETTDYWRRRNGKFRAQCKHCLAAYQRAYRAAHPGIHRQYYAANRERVLQQQQAWRNRNRAKVNAWQRASYARDPQRYISHVREYEKRNPEKKRAHNRKANAKLRERTAVRRAQLQASMKERGLISTLEAAALLNYSPATIYEWTRAGKWPAPVDHIASTKYYRISDVLQAAGRAPTLELVEQELVQEYRANLPDEWLKNGFKLVESLSCRHVQVDVIVGTRHGVMCAVCGKVAATGRVHKDMQRVAERLEAAG